MKKVRLTLAAVLSVAICITVLTCFAPAKINASAPEGQTINMTVPVSFEEAKADEKAEVVVESFDSNQEETAVNELSDSDKILLMLNRNYCYNSSLEDIGAMVGCATVTLFDLAIEDENGEFTISSALVCDFLKNFYGVDVTYEQMAEFCVEQNRVKVAEIECGVFEHNLVSLTEQDGVLVAVTCMTSYYGGDDVEKSLVKSKFVKNPESDYGFNLIYCEIL